MARKRSAKAGDNGGHDNSCAVILTLITLPIASLAVVYEVHQRDIQSRVLSTILPLTAGLQEEVVNLIALASAIARNKEAGIARTLPLQQAC